MIQVHVYVLLSLYAMLFASLAICLVLFLSVKKEVRRSEGRMKKQQIYLQEAYDRLEAGMAVIQSGLKDVDDKTSTYVPPAPTKSGLNLSKRSQAVRMFRRGDRPDQIATALSMPLSEVNLLIKVQETAIAAQAN